MIYGRL